MFQRCHDLLSAKFIQGARDVREPGRSGSKTDREAEVFFFNTLKFPYNHNTQGPDVNI